MRRIVGIAAVAAVLIGPAPVAGYSTDIIEVLKGGAVRERLDLESTTKLLLRRRQFDSHGALERAFEFDQIHIGDASMTTPTMPPAPKRAGPKPLRARDVPA